MSSSECRLHSAVSPTSTSQLNTQSREMFHEEVTSDIRSFASGWGKTWGLLSELSDEIVASSGNYHLKHPYLTGIPMSEESLSHTKVWN